ncbi:MAG TPA: PqiC family protein [Anaeromyxobacteraceae bacterium]|nr:PqiC family protein [Anaeromyxobacteraceae bacterium]
MRISRPSLVLVALLGTACLNPRPDTSRYYTLSADRVQPPPGRRVVAALGLGPVVLPPYLDRSEFALRIGPDEIAYASDERWAAPLADLFARALAEDLRALVPAAQVVPWPYSPASPPDISVAVDVLRFEADASGKVSFEARFSLRGGGKVLAQGETRFQESVTARDTPAAAASLSRAIAALARDVADAAAGVPRP